MRSPHGGVAWMHHCLHALLVNWLGCVYAGICYRRHGSLAIYAHGLQAATLHILLPERAVSILDRRCSGEHLEALGTLSSPDQAARCLPSRTTSKLARSCTTTRESAGVDDNT